MGGLSAAGLALLALTTATGFRPDPPPDPPPSYWLQIDLFPNRETPEPDAPTPTVTRPGYTPLPVPVPRPVAPPVAGRPEPPTPPPSAPPPPPVPPDPRPTPIFSTTPISSPRADNPDDEPTGEAAGDRPRAEKAEVSGFQPLRTRPEPLKAVLVVVVVAILITALTGAVFSAVR
ncbi:hypothetical protein [Actinocorallia sp. A-T 12471]|uniref:hypothetical protein n=1 Tax=Actinocorallia sp. A-T 12471 TaxID=3089813 RepID=UPI0029D09299|nr:hypothetical protein [Actinocorallia sp. A-T 12471]MDX6743650.1 hypothetical protein [Actinocorallia sp. A-T 12471]